jgi:SAM-dependent methyltransferase
MAKDDFVTPADFYDQLAPYYHLLFHGDFNATINYHGWAMDNIIRQQWGDSVREVLDVSCGIGTQALGLAQRGYQVTASDVSRAAVTRATQEAANRGLVLNFSVSDMREASRHHGRQFDVVIAVENAIPHLLSDDEILLAFRELYTCCRPGGGFLISVRDYDNEDPISPQIRPYPLKVVGDTKYLIFQVWEFDGPIYDVTVYVVADDGVRSPETIVARSKYYAISIDKLMQLMSSAGFEEIERIDDMYFQPTLVGTRGQPEGTSHAFRVTN